jgi:molybdopterin-synthase adenylyltransferase
MKGTGVKLLSENDRIRYHRQMMLEDWGEEGQVKLKSSSAFVAGAGGLGSPVCLYLAAAGVGRIRVCDEDVVELSNLNRQILHNTASIGYHKVLSAQRTLAQLNPEVEVEALIARIEADTLHALVGHPDIVIDCLDNYEARYALNAYCARHGIPLVHGAISGMMGQVTFLQPPDTPCLRCIIPHAPSAEGVPAVGAIAGLVGCIQAAEAIKYLTGVGTPLLGRLMIVSGLEMSFDSLVVHPRDECPDCWELQRAAHR